nr:DUF485 domain-containing protein [Pseudomonas aeruginosa]
MSSLLYARIRASARFQQLVARRNRFTLSLLLLILATFHGYIALVSFCPELIARRLAQGSNMTLASRPACSCSCFSVPCRRSMCTAPTANSIA